MVVHDKSTTVCCSRCSDEYTVTGYLLSERTMRRKVKNLGWTVIDNEDMCPKCTEKYSNTSALPKRHFTAAQMVQFKEATLLAKRENEETFLCPICKSEVSILNNLEIASCKAECPGCGLTFR